MWGAQSLSKQLVVVLLRQLDEYVEGPLNPEQLSVSLWAGELVLQGVVLRRDLVDRALRPTASPSAAATLPATPVANSPRRGWAS